MNSDIENYRTEDGARPQSLGETTRPYIDVIDRLRDIGLDREVNLPTIAIIGDQSSGKSSVLEAISGVSLPRGTGMVTRCPLVMRLRNSRGGSWRCMVSYYINREQQTVDITEPEDVEKAIKDAQTRLLELTQPSDDISEEAITLDVVSDDVPDLTLIDLPGLIAVATRGQHNNIPDRIERLVQRWIEVPETIILVVVPANVDIANTRALKMAERVDHEHERTLGIITKPDLIDRGTEQQLIGILRNAGSVRTYHLKKGYSVVKCRSQQRIDERQSWSDALKEERQFFDHSDHFRSVDNYVLGVSNLQEKLSRELVAHIKKYLPKLQESLALKRVEVEDEFEQLEEELPNDKELQMKHFIESLTKMIDRIHDECEGDYKFMDERCTRLYTIVKEHYEEFEVEINKKNPDHVTEIQAIQEYVETYRGPEFPPFKKYAVFINRAKEYLKQCRPPARNCLEKSYQAMGKMLVQMVELTFSKYAHLADRIKDLMFILMRENKAICKERLEEEFDKENIIFTQDSLYLQKREPLGISVPVDGGITSDPGINELFLAFIAFVKISQQRMVDNIPLTVTLHMLKKLPEKIRTETTALIARDDLVGMIRESEESARKREELRGRLWKLSRAKEALDRI